MTTLIKVSEKQIRSFMQIETNKDLFTVKDVIIVLLRLEYYSLEFHPTPAAAER